MASDSTCADSTAFVCFGFCSRTHLSTWRLSSCHMHSWFDSFVVFSTLFLCGSFHRFVCICTVCSPSAAASAGESVAPAACTVCPVCAATAQRDAGLNLWCAIPFLTTFCTQAQQSLATTDRNASPAWFLLFSGDRHHADGTVYIHSHDTMIIATRHMHDTEVVFNCCC